MIERVRWDRKKAMWGTLGDGAVTNFDPCRFVVHFIHGIMFRVTTHTESPAGVRGCAPHTNIVGWAEGELEIRTHGTLAIGVNAVQVRFDGSDFYAGTQLVKSCEKMFFFKDGCCLVEGIS